MEASRAAEGLAVAMGLLWRDVRRFAYLGRLCGRSEPIGINEIAEVVGLSVDELRESGVKDPDDGDKIASWLFDQGLVEAGPNDSNTVKHAYYFLDAFLGEFRRSALCLSSSSTFVRPPAAGIAEHCGAAGESYHALTLTIARDWYHHAWMMHDHVDAIAGIGRTCDVAHEHEFLTADIVAGGCPWPRIADGMRWGLKGEFDSDVLVAHIRSEAAVAPDDLPNVEDQDGHTERPRYLGNGKVLMPDGEALHLEGRHRQSAIELLLAGPATTNELRQAGVVNPSKTVSDLRKQIGSDWVIRPRDPKGKPGLYSVRVSDERERTEV